MLPLSESFTGPLHPRLKTLLIGGGSSARSVQSPPSLRLTLPPTRQYADAQVDDYHDLSRARFPCRPPLRLTLRARASSPSPTGTLGFGFWNDPFTFSLGQGGAARKLPASPNTAWFFYASPPNQMELAPGVPGHGWKAATLNGGHPPALLLAPAAAVMGAMMAVPGVRTLAMGIARRAVRASEQLLDTRLDEWHAYEIVWEAGRVEFRVDGREVHESRNPPTPPLGFVAWIDNQYAVASREGKFGFGVVPTKGEQWLEVAELRVVPL